ncbi:MAG: DUF3987 domain-containing protein, partial [Hyphomicrobiaceae bacterium]
MKPADQLSYNPTSEKLVEILRDKTQNDNPTFFRVLIAYYFSLAAAMMRVSIDTPDRGKIPINLYAINLSGSGSGKGYSMSIMEDEVLHRFRDTFLNSTFLLMAEDSFPTLAHKRAAKKGTDPGDEEEKVKKEFDNLGPMPFSFDSGTAPAVKQLRTKILMARSGAVNLQMDEIGSNFASNTEVLNTFLELFDKGVIKQKLVKNTTENARAEDIIGATPTNMLLFGTPSKLLNGSTTEQDFYSMLETGYARRCFFGYNRKHAKRLDLTAEEVFAMQTNPEHTTFLNNLAEHLESMADMVHANRTLKVSHETSLELIRYKHDCEMIAESLAEHQEIQKAEISHRYFKALKLAGAYAFIENSSEVTLLHLEQAVKLAEESGEAFNRLLSKEQNWVKLARYICSLPNEVTQAELMDALPFYKGAASQRQDMLTLAISHGYRNNMIIKKQFIDGIEFLKGETLKETNIEEMILSWSEDIAEGYKPERVAFSKLSTMTNYPTFLHWCNHHMMAGHRQEENAIMGFNMIVIDVDSGKIPITFVQEMLKEYTFFIHTTKRSTPDEPRFRLIMPISHELKLDAKDFKEFMANVAEWLPFDTDRSAQQRARKWLTNPTGQTFINQGQMLDALPFIPKTSKNEERKAKLQTQQQMDNLERWF